MRWQSSEFSSPSPLWFSANGISEAGRVRGRECGNFCVSFPLLPHFGLRSGSGWSLNGRCPVLCGSRPWCCLVPFLSGSGLAMSRLVGLSGNVVALPCLEKARGGDFTRTFSARLAGSVRFWPVPVPSGRWRVSCSGPWRAFWARYPFPLSSGSGVGCLVRSRWRSVPAIEKFTRLPSSRVASKRLGLASRTSVDGTKKPGWALECPGGWLGCGLRRQIA